MPVLCVCIYMDKNMAYFLGWAWGDGYLRARSKTSMRFGIEIIKSDADQVFSNFDITCKTQLRHRKREGRKQSSTLTSCDYNFCSTLRSYGYLSKSNKPPTRVLESIPEELKPYWFRGFFEADGSISISKQSTGNFLSFRAEFYGPINYDWSFLCDFLNDHHISYKISKRVRKSGSSSLVTISKIKDISKLGSILYSKNDFSLKRKSDKFIIVNDYIESNNKQKFTIDYFLKLGHPA